MLLKSKLQFFVSLMTFGLFIATLILALQEAEHYVPDEQKRWDYKNSWNFFSKEQK